jgi:hypothetical protein
MQSTVQKAIYPTQKGTKKKKNPDTIHTKPNKIKQHPDHQNSKNSWKRKKLRKIRNLSYQPSIPE